MEKVDYRPKNIEFDVANSSIMPENLGEYKTADEAIQFIHKNVVGINQRITVSRFMDNFEKTELRKEYQEILELKMPILEKDLQKATHEFEEAKKKLADAKELVNATTNEVKAIANDVKRGLKDIQLDDQFTWRIAFECRYFFYSYIDKQIKLAKIQDIPEHEKQDLFNVMSKNEEFFNDNFGKKDE